MMTGRRGAVAKGGRRWFAVTGLALAIASIQGHTVALASGMQVDPAGQADSDGARHSFDIKAQSLGAAIIELSRQGDVVVTAPTQLLDGKSAPALRGSYTVEQALRALLTESGLVYRRNAPGSFVIEDTVVSGPRADATQLDTVMVFGTLEDELSVGSKSGQSLRETPKSVTVMSNERIEAQNLTDLQQVMQQTTGVTVGAYSPLDNFFLSRGFRVQTLQFDGGAPAQMSTLGFFYYPDTTTLDHVEMLRGVDGMYSGAGEPGGVINLVRKRPDGAKALRLDLSAGSWDNYQASVDVTGPLALDGRLRGRAVASYTDKGYFWDNYTTEKKVLYGVVEFDATESTLLALGMSYENRDDDNYIGWAGVPRFIDGSPLGFPRNVSFAPDWAKVSYINKEIFGRVEQRYGESGTLRLNLSQIRQEAESKYATLTGYIDPVTLEGAYFDVTHSRSRPVQNLADLSASGKFRLWGREHRYTVGTDYSKLDGGNRKTYEMLNYTYDDAVQVPIFTYNPADYPEMPSALVNYYPQWEQTQKGFYANVNLQLAEPLRLAIGGRYGEFDYLQVLHPRGNAANASVVRYSDTAFIPSAALSYTLTDRWTAYLSYGENFKVQASMTSGPPPGTPLDPITGSSLELGIKGQLFARLNAAAAIYRVERNGQGVADPAYPRTNLQDGSSCCYLAQSDVSVEGVDLEVSGLVAPGWQLFAGYTYVRTLYDVADPGYWSNGGAMMSRTPRHQFKMWSTWKLPGEWYRWTFNTGLIAQSESFNRGSVPQDPNASPIVWVPYQFTQGGYSLWNASIQYEISDTWNVGLYGDNLTDKTYYQAIGSINSENVYGTPRSYTLSLRGRW